jgi:nucleotide-binding universal stress UspA family protein
MFERILVPLDGSIRAARAVPIAARIASATHGSIILVSVVNHFVLIEPSPIRNNRIQASNGFSMSEAETYLEEIASSLECAQLTVEKATFSGPVASTLLYTATSYRADLIVMSSHGRSGMMSKMLGSISEKVLSQATIPVLLLRENDPLPPLEILNSSHLQSGGTSL